MDLPPAPTPPVNTGGASDRTANLLNLLKFSSSGSQKQQLPGSQKQQFPASHQQSPPQPPQHLPQHLPQHQLQDHGQPQLQHPRQPGFGQSPYHIHQPAPAGADPSGLLAALMRGVHEPDEPRQAPMPPAAAHPPPPAAASWGPGSPLSDTRSYLNLLNRPKPSQTDQAMLTETSRSNGPTPQSPEAAADVNRYFGQYQQPANAYQPPQHYQPPPAHQQQQLRHQSDSFADVQHPASNVSSFSFAQTRESSTDMSALYQQLMGSLQQSSPPHGSNIQASTGTQPFLAKDQASPAGSHHLDQHRAANAERSPVTSLPEHPRRNVDRSSSLHSHHSPQQLVKQTPPTSDLDSFGLADKAKETVAEAVSDLASKADRDAREALDRAEQGMQQPAAPADFGRQHAGPDDGQESDEPATDEPATAESAEQHAEDDAKPDPGKETADESVEASSYAPNMSEPAHAAAADNGQAVADSWESADQEEIVVIEDKEPPPVRVYNFPMKPWISITLQEDSTDPRPLFRDESIMDIARLKKDFDQMDRNLYTASQTYMTYGMSKQGGLRVIRQDDGKDAKVFTDTKDRIFNVAMSVTPDNEAVQREAIIGTGISGTVYWVQIKDGEKDHIEDAHLEQYGFALPPMAAQDGDTPGGVLKTRARASTIHPEYFAVGRGKSINFIWPSYIMQNKLFKTGHDRVVDTEALLKQCSLKINTGKAGKDFTFSQDDTVVVSLDKSGRVKFWDVRDLTAVKEGCDARAPVPAQTSLEVKEPLLTLASTPEGEKAWPTSVLLLDKQRPFQKRCALRYMIIGMKQNHTLQLWDLALGKPVQEFNLPHGKESDAACSVMYHPASGMVVIGHPTRNSVYFAHLSAPKYNLKSVSQAEYIQRLVAQDSSIPQPDSTAVISGVREYSFANRGVIRSLDILCNPAMLQDADEPTLFELYAMHSKGVACLLVKQCELGWSKDNKVLDAVDAVKEGVVTVSKLKAPQLPEGGNNGGGGDAGPVRIAGRAKESLAQSTPVPSDTAQHGAESATPVRLKDDAKELETPGQSSKENNQGEKPERRPRKKKGAPGSKDAEPATNGTSSISPKGTAAGNKQPEAAKASSDTLGAAVAGLGTRLTTAMSETLKASLKNLHGKIDEGARARDENFHMHQLKLLDMVSEVLNENTQKVLESLIHHQFTELVIPAIGDHAGKAVKDLQPSIASAIQKDVQHALPQALGRSLRSPDFINSIADRVCSAVVSGVEQELLATLTQRLEPTLSSVASQSAQRVASGLHQQYQDQFERMRAQHAADSTKIDQLLTYVSRLTDMVSTMAASQSSLQAEFLKLKQQTVHELPGVPGVPGVAQGSQQQTGLGVLHGMGAQYGAQYGAGSSNAPSHHGSFAGSQPSLGPSQPSQPYMVSPQYMRGSQPVTSPQGRSVATSEHVGPANVSALAGAFANQMSKSESEADHELVQRIHKIEKAIQEGRLQEAMIQWIQSGHERDIFRRCLSAYPPSRFDSLPPLLLLVVIATISKDLKPNPRLKQEVDWIEMAVRAFGDSLPGYDWEGQGFGEVMKSASQTMQLLMARLKPLVASFTDGFPLDPFLANVDKGKMEWIVRSSEHILESFGGARRYD